MTGSLFEGGPECPLTGDRAAVAKFDDWLLSEPDEEGQTVSEGAPPGKFLPQVADYARAEDGSVLLDENGKALPIRASSAVATEAIDPAPWYKNGGVTLSDSAFYGRLTPKAWRRSAWKRDKYEQ
jgi:hypothetical protein